MTTIAYKAGLMACDSCWTLDDIVVTLKNKIYKLPSGALLGQAGDNDCREMEIFLGRIKSPKSIPTRKALLELRLDFAGIWVLPGGDVFKVTCREDVLDYKDEVGFTPINRKFAACGSGNQMALGVMAHGGSALEAVKIAADFDVNTRGPFHQARLR